MAEKKNRMMVIDTNVFVDHLRNFKPAVAFFESIAKHNDVLFSAITESELLAGNANDDSSKREILLCFLSNWTKVSVTNPIALLAGDISRKYNLLIPDSIIAATALANNAELLTKNIKDFKRVKGLFIRHPY